jgi:hypothetical protein
MSTGSIDFANGILHFGDWEKTCGVPLIHFTPSFYFTESFGADKKAEEAGFLAKITGWFTDLFGNDQEKAANAAKAAWSKLDAHSNGCLVISAAASPIIGDCEGNFCTVKLKLYLSVKIWYGATAQTDSIGGTVKAASQFELALPGHADPVDCGKCPCGEKKTTLLVFPGLWNGGVYVSTIGWPDITVAAAGVDNSTLFSLPTLSEITEGHDALAETMSTAQGQRVSVPSERNSRSSRIPKAPRPRG